jgi:hypothetical protein
VQSWHGRNEEEALMTSEGQYAGSQPAEATSGGPLSDGFPPDSDGQRISGRASAQPPADGFPSSYAPPPASTPHGGSPFVVPAVRTFGNGSEAAGAPYRAPQADHGEALPQRGAASPDGADGDGAPGGGPNGDSERGGANGDSERGGANGDSERGGGANGEVVPGETEPYGEAALRCGSAPLPSSGCAGRAEPYGVPAGAAG